MNGTGSGGQVRLKETMNITDVVEAFDATFSPKERKWMPSQEEFYIYSHSSVTR